MLLNPAAYCWILLYAAGCCCILLDTLGCCWILLDTAGCWLVVRGHEDESVLLNKPARDRDFLKWAAEFEAAKLKQRMDRMDKGCTPRRGGLGTVA